MALVRPTTVLKYAGAVAFMGLAIFLTFISPLKEGSPFLLLFVAVLVTARYIGLGPALVSSLIGSIAAVYLFLDPTFTFSSSRDILRLFTFLFVSLTGTWFIAAHEVERRRAMVQAVQQAAVAQLGQQAVASRNLAALLEESTRVVCETLQVEYANVLELLPGEKGLLLRTGYGWMPGRVGTAIVGGGMDSQGGYTLASGQPVVVRDLRKESRFNRPPLLLEHHVISGMSVIIGGRDKPFGVLGAHSTRERAFSHDDVSFLQSVANVIASAIERTRTEAEIQKQREWLQVTLSSIGDGVVTTDARGRIEFINPVCEQITGWSPKDVVGKPFSDVFRIHEVATDDRVPDPVTRVITEGQPIGSSNHTVLLVESDRRIPIETSAAPIRDLKGNLVGVIMTFRDITARQTAERAIRESEERYRTIAETAKDAIITVDDGGLIVLANPAVEKVFGYSVQELLGQSLTMLMPEEQRDLHQASIKDYLATSEKHRSWSGIELQGLHKSGRLIPLDISLGEYERDGKHYFTSVIRDVSERRAVEDQLRFQAHVLKSVRDSVIVSDLDGNIIYWNDGATFTFGYTANEMAGKKMSQLISNEASDPSTVEGAPLSADGDDVRELKAWRKNGSAVWLNVKTTPLRDAAEAVIGFITISTDITQRKRVEDRLITQNAITRALAESETVSIATPKILQNTCTLLDWEVGVLWGLDQEVDVLRCLDLWRPSEMDIREFESLTREMLFTRGVGIPGRVWEASCPEWIEDITLDSTAPRAKVAAKNDLHGAAGFPIMTGNEFIGVIEFFSRRLRQPDRELVQMMDLLGSQIGQFIKRKRAEEALRLSQEQYSIILQGVGDGITAQDPTGRLIYANQAAAQIIGYASPQELLETPMHKVMERFEVLDEQGNPLPPSGLPGRIALQSRRPAESLLRFRIGSSGEEHWSQINAVPILDESGQVRFAINIFHEVTEQRRAQESLREQRELLRVTLASIGDAVISTDVRGRITFMNKVAERLTGWSLDEAVGDPLEQVFKIQGEDTGLALPNPAERVIQDRQGVGLPNHTLLISRDGKQIPIDDSAAPIRDKEDNVIGVVLVFRDIAERRRVERDASRLAALVKSSDDVIVSKALDGTILTWNPAAERLFGYRAEEVIGKPITVIYPPDRLPEFERNMRSLRRGESIDQFDTVRVTKDGRSISVSVSISLIRDSQGNVIGASKIVRDITERLRAEQAAQFLAEASDVLSSSLDYETTLASVAKLAAPRIADWCAIYMQADDGTIRRLALAHIDPAKIELVQQLSERYPPRPEELQGVYNVLRTGQPEMVTELTDEMIARAARDVEHLKLLTEVGIKSYMAVPMIARGRTLGVVVLVSSSSSSRRYGLEDLMLAQDLARRAAFAIDNARLYREAQALNEELEQRVVRRTIELQNTNRQLETEIAHRERMNAQLRSLSGHLQSTREEERIRIAREIHDEIGQVLTAVKMDLGLLARELTGNGDRLSHEEIQRGIQSTSTLVDNALQTMHNIIRELRPEVLDHLGLRAALEWQIQEFQTRTKIDFDFQSDLDDSELDLDRSTAVFRILQETLTNVVRHANASKVNVDLRREDGSLLLYVRDNGRGISESSLTNSSRFGILGMRERALALGGNVEIRGEPGRGTVVTARIPLALSAPSSPEA